MKIRMLVDRSGFDIGADGKPYFWPPRGGEILVPDALGAAVCGAGWAEPVAVSPPVETRAAELPAPEPEPAPEPPADPVPAPEDPAPAQDGPEAPSPAHRRKASGK